MSHKCAKCKRQACKSLTNAQSTVAVVRITTKNETHLPATKKEASHWECKIECEGIFISKHHGERCQNFVGFFFCFFFFCQIRGRSGEFEKGFRVREWDQGHVREWEGVRVWGKVPEEVGSESDLDTDGQICPFWGSLIATWSPQEKDIIMSSFWSETNCSTVPF